MHDAINNSNLPKHARLCLEERGIMLVAYRSADVASSLKMAQWRGKFDGMDTPHRDDCHTIWVHDSGASIRRKGSDTVMVPGTVFIHPAQDGGIFHSDSQLDFTHIYLPVKTLADLASEFSDGETALESLPMRYGVRDKELTTAVLDMVNTIRDTADPSTIQFDEWTMDIGMVLLDSVNRREGHPLCGKMQSSLTAQQISDVVDFVEARLAGRITMFELASLCGISQFRFLRAFKAETGFNPHQYVIERRVARAKALLQTSEETIADIAYGVGFSSQAHMTDVFRKREGVTPGQFRRIVRG